MGGFIYSLDSQRGKAGCQCLADRKLVLLIADGLADRPVIDYDYKTPLEYANTPNMDRLAKGGLVGQLDPISPGVRAGSNVANLALLGYDPAKYYTGRGALEASPLVHLFPCST